MFKIFIVLLIFYKLRKFFFKLPSFFYWIFRDFKHYKKYGKGFDQYGLRMFCGRQGGGKTVGMVWLLEQWRRKYPNLKIYTNIDYSHQDGKLTGWNDLLDQELRNGTDGVVFCIDEIQNEFSSSAWKDFPETILSEITQQRKQRICNLTPAIFKHLISLR
jgi:ATP-dependent Clp protease ATP-binding subunit ClpX